jgi:hypothetical protein
VERLAIVRCLHIVHLTCTLKCHTIWENSKYLQLEILFLESVKRSSRAKWMSIITSRPIMGMNLFALWLAIQNSCVVVYELSIQDINKEMM